MEITDNLEKESLFQSLFEFSRVIKTQMLRKCVLPELLKSFYLVPTNALLQFIFHGRGEDVDRVLAASDEAVGLIEELR